MLSVLSRQQGGWLQFFMKYIRFKGLLPTRMPASPFSDMYHSAWLRHFHRHHANWDLFECFTWFSVCEYMSGTLFCCFMVEIVFMSHSWEVESTLLQHYLFGHCFCAYSNNYFSAAQVVICYIKMLSLVIYSISLVCGHVWLIPLMCCALARRIEGIDQCALYVVPPWYYLLCGVWERNVFHRSVQLQVNCHSSILPES